MPITNPAIRTGATVQLDRRASVQFAGPCAIRLRILKICTKPTYDGWVWLTGYVVDRTGQASDKREVFVQIDGVRPA